MKYLAIFLLMTNIYASSSETEAEKNRKKAMEVYYNSKNMQEYTQCLQKVRTPEDHKKCFELRQKAVKEMQDKMKNQ